MKKEFIIERSGRSFVLYAGLLDAAHGQGLKSISTTLLQAPAPDNGHMAICQATVVTERGEFSGIGDASPANVHREMAACLVRMAETRAKARALRDAINVGMVALEELGADQEAEEPRAAGEFEEAQRASFESMFDFGAPRPMSGDTEARATERQLKAIFAIGRGAANLTEHEIQVRAQEVFGRPPQELSKREASQFIDLLKQDSAA